MIRKFGFRNFSSFRDGAEISFVGKDSLEYDSEQIEGVSSVIGIKGANGSGKTNILKAISFLYCFCSKRVVTTKSSESGISEIEIPIQSFMNNLECTEFYIEFSHGNLIYYYELDITIKGIQREELRRKNKKEITCITREKNKITHCLNEFSEITKLKLRSDQSIVSVVQDFDFSNPMIDLNEVNLMFQRIIFNVGYDGYKTIETENFFYSSEFYHNNPESLEFCKRIISGVDDGIIDIEIESTHDSKSGDTIYYPIFIHSHNESELKIGLDQESMGTKALFLNLYKYWLVLKDGALLVFDEFDTHLHPMILPEIIELFQSKSINKKNAQLLITAHNTEIIDSLGRYNTVLVNKENNESYCYRLDEISLLRNDRSISPIYKKGKIGGIPRNIQGLTSRIVTEMETK